MRRATIVSRYFSGASLREPLSGIPASQPAGPIDTAIKHVKTSSGFEIVTVDAASPYSAAVVAFRAGSRFEDQYNHGSAAHLAKLLYFANASGKTNVKTTRDLLLSTTNQYAKSHRETLSYALEFSRDHLSSAVQQLGEVVQPLARGWELEDSREFLEEDAQDALADDSSIIEAAHWVAFRGTGLAKVSVPPQPDTTEDKLQEYRRQYLNRSNAVIVGVGVDHAQFVAAVEQGFAGLPTGNKASAAPSKYVGGESHVEGSDQPLFALAFESGSLSSRDFLAAGVLQQLLGRTPDRLYNKPRPGHGLSSRLNRRLGGEGSVIFADSFVSAYSDAGLFGVFGQALSGHEGAVVEAAATELGSLARNALSDAELQGAKLRLKFAILSGAETVDMKGHFYARQALFSGKVLCRNEYVAQVDSLTAKDIQAAAKKFLSATPTFVTEGNSCKVPSLSDLRSRLQ